ncbi:MAG: sulfatase-like hydrolase/transferase [Alphaproteobacteria bacterium]|mgnify:CR=1 FL=1|jgi:hypothetical protein|nr:sulfatase-like hydrolase/transferase [Alphaproteobacteria bacterium]MBT5390596.1 sulfatase-like hydrolase/transferase [Alphaproteobacteria bacterium]MBT5540652.1 sulfatase-like hydrolase/transferase [Alphaproteobacteria bacterium]MBT5654357.1 sulfatase-like hydrolase/transferase [Alphaproteobacteria bacterium]
MPKLDSLINKITPRDIAKVILILAGLFLTNAQVSSRFIYFITHDRFFPLVVYTGIWSVSIAALLAIAFLCSRKTKWFWTILIGFSTLAGMTYFNVTREVLSFDSLELLWNGRYDALAMFEGGSSDNGGQALYLFLPQFLQALLGTVLLAIGLLLRTPQQSFRIPNTIKRIAYLIPILPSLLIGNVVCHLGGASETDTQGMPKQFDLVSLTGLFIYENTTRSTKKKEAVIVAKRDSPPQHIILIVDESIHGGYISLNRDCGTTPYLESIQKQIANFGFASAGNNGSAGSNAILRLGAHPDKIGKENGNVLDEPSIWKYAAKAGFETTRVDGQVQGRLVNYMTKDELDLIDNVIIVENVPRHDMDMEVAKILQKIIKKDKPQFVYVNKQGAHFPYEGSYPTSQKLYQPCMSNSESISNRERMVNSYKNAISWTVDHFFEVLLTDASLENTVVIYTGDHGQNLLHDGQVVTHSRRVSPDPNEAIVPIFVLTHDKALLKQFKTAAETNKHNTSHFNIFPTILTLMGYESEDVHNLYGLALTDPITKPHGFISGSILGRFGKPLVWNPRPDFHKLVESM